MSWDDWQVFLAAHRTGSHARAGRTLGVDPTTVGRRLAALEAEVGGRLFDRTPSGLVLTPEGQAVLGRAERIETEVTAALRELRGADARLEGVLRVTATDGLINHVLLPALASLRLQHPGLCLDVRADTRLLDLSRREADVAVRLVRPKEPALVARRIGRLELALFASPEYLNRQAVPRRSSDLAHHDFVGFESDLDHLPQVRWLHKITPKPRYVVRTNTSTAQAIACAEGHGIALLPVFFGKRESRLSRVLPRLTGPARDVWAVTHGDMRRNARVVVFTDWLATVLDSAASGRKDEDTEG